MIKIKNYYATKIGFVILAYAAGSFCLSDDKAETVSRKTGSVFFPPALISNAQKNIKKFTWAAEIEKEIIKMAAPFLNKSDDELWNSMFCSGILRAPSVLAYGHCPICKKAVTLYSWKSDPLKNPWKVECPHCAELFPKNDFAKYYRSGLNKLGFFDRDKADSSLLFNAEHPNPKDPLYKFGVDDGNGYVDGANRWRFIGNCLYDGHWYKLVLFGIESLANAYAVTGKIEYGHKALILLDRAADMYPFFDGSKQIIDQERIDAAGHRGYITRWHSCVTDTSKLVLAYDQVFSALKNNPALISYLSKKAAALGLKNPKTSPALIAKNIEDGLLSDPMKNIPKVLGNPPRTDMLIIYIKTVMGWPSNKKEILEIIENVAVQSTKVDGMTGEKGLTIYTALGVHALTEMLARFNQIEHGLMEELFLKVPNLRKTWRFHIDTRCGAYYPQIGDGGSFGRQFNQYQGAPAFMEGGKPKLTYSSAPFFPPSTETFLWQLFKATGDPAYLQASYERNKNSAEGLPFDVFADDPMQIQNDIINAVKNYGPRPALPSVDRDQFRLAILRSGKGENERHVWLNYDSMGPHGHADGMNLGLFAKGLDLMPDLGYPPTKHKGSWNSPQAVWYMKTAAHNTVEINRKNQGGQSYRYQVMPNSGKSTLFFDGGMFHAVQASGTGMASTEQYERSISLIDVSDQDFYVVDLFRAAGGSEHIKYFHSFFGSITAAGLTLSDVKPDFAAELLMTNFKGDMSPKPGWSIEWTIEDYYKVLPQGKTVKLRYTDLTKGAEAYAALGFCDVGEEKWIPRVMTRTHSDTGPLISTFISIIQTYEKEPIVKTKEQLIARDYRGEKFPDNHVALKLTLFNGDKDIFISRDTRNLLGEGDATQAASWREILIDELNLTAKGRLFFIRVGKNNKVKRIALAGAYIKVMNVTLETTGILTGEQMEIAFSDDGNAEVISGSFWNIIKLEIDGKPCTIK